jgi:hypothetical protein
VQNDPAVLDALAHLSRFQTEDGSWTPLPACAECGPGADVDRAAATALALLAFIRSGIPTREACFHEGVRLDESLRRGLRWLTADQDPGGGRSLRSRAMAAVVFHEAGPGSLLLGEASDRSTAFLLAAPLGSADAETIGWAVHAILLGRPGAPALTEWSAGARSALDTLPAPDGSAAVAWAAIARMRLDRTPSVVSDAVEVLLRSRPAADRPDLAGWYAGTWALLQYDGPNGFQWKSWRASLVPVLEGRLQSTKCPQGAAWLAQMLQALHPPVWRSRYGRRSS